MAAAWRWPLAAAAGAVAALAQPGPDLWPLAFVAPGLLLAALPPDHRPWRSGLLGWLAGAVFWIVSVHWVVPVMDHYGGLPWLLAVACLGVMGVILGAVWAVAAAVTGWVRPQWRPWVLPAAWILGEAFRELPVMQFPWAPTAAALTAVPAGLGSLATWGAAGLGWAVLAGGAGIAAVLDRRTRRSGLWLVAVVAVATVAATVAAPPPDADGDPIRVALIQPGTSLEEKWDPGRWDEVRERVTALTARAAAADPDLVLWPESAMPYRVGDDPTYRSMLVETARAADAVVILNSVGRTADGGWTNSAYLVDPSGIAPERYDKLRLVPFGEYVPVWARLAFASSLVREVGTFEPGEATVVLPGPVPVGVAICYEVAFGGLASDAVREGAELLVSLTNDAWYGFSWAPRQHLALARLRAVETRRWLARAALTGISACVDPAGRLHAVQPVGASGFDVCEVVPASVRTPRTRFGDWWLAVCAVVVVAALVAGRRGSPI